MTSCRGSDDLETCQAIISQILSLPDRYPFLISTTIQLDELEFSKPTEDPDVLMDRVLSQYEQVHQALCSFIIVDATGSSEPINPVSFEFVDIEDAGDQRCTVHSITQIHPETLSRFEYLMDMQFQPIIDLLPGMFIISMTARPITRDE